MALPEFERPPVIEVALAVQFEPLDGFRAVHFGLFWSRIRNRFPRVEEHPTLPSVETILEPDPNARPSIEVRTGHVMTQPRVWYLNDRGTELVQLQTDRLAFNWRRGEADQEYPRFERVEQGLRDALTELRDFVATENLGVIRLVRSEVSYVNVIEHATAARPSPIEMLRLSATPESKGVLKAATPVANSWDSQVTDGAGRKVAVGRLTAETAMRPSDGAMTTLLRLSVWGKPSEEADGLHRFFRLGHDWIVQAFDEATTEAQHRAWGRRNREN